MAVATMELSETNLVGVVVTNGITNLNFVTTDTPSTTVSDAVAITAGNNSKEKYIRYHLITNTSANTIQKLITWISTGTNPITANCTLKTSAIEAELAAPAYATPDTVTSTKAVNTMPVAGAKPTTGNVCIGSTRTPAAPPVHGTGCLITADTYSDYIVFQLQTTAAATVGTQGVPAVISFQYDEIA